MILLSLGIIIGLLLSLTVYIYEAKAKPYLFEKIDRKVDESMKGVIFDKPLFIEEFEENDAKGVDTVL